MYDRDLGISHEIKEKPKIVAPKVHDSTTVAQNREEKKKQMLQIIKSSNDMYKVELSIIFELVFSYVLQSENRYETSR